MVILEGAAEPSASDTNSWRQSPGSKLCFCQTAIQHRANETGGQPGVENSAGLEPTGGVSNYIRGNDAKDSLNGIPHYARLSVAGVYDGVDLVFYSNGGDLEYDFVVAPGADPKQIRLAFDGQERMRVDEKSGDLVLTTAGGSELRQVRPQVYQQLGNQRVEVAGGYQLLDHGRAAFTLASYQHRRPLVIDPTGEILTGLQSRLERGCIRGSRGLQWQFVHHWQDVTGELSGNGWFEMAGSRRRLCSVQFLRVSL